MEFRNIRAGASTPHRVLPSRTMQDSSRTPERSVRGGPIASQGTSATQITRQLHGPAAEHLDHFPTCYSTSFASFVSWHTPWGTHEFRLHTGLHLALFANDYLVW